MSFSHIQERALAMSRLPQTGFQTPYPVNTSNPLNYVQMLVKDQNLANFAPSTKNNDGFSNRSDFPTENYLDRWDVSANHQLQLEMDMIGRILYAALGAITSSQPDAGGNPNVYKHALKPMAPFTGRQLPYYTFIEKIGTSSLDQQFNSMVVERLVIRGTGTDRLEIDVTWRGSGKRNAPSNVNFSGGSNNVKPATGLRYLLNTQAVLKTSNYTTITCTFDNTTDKVMRATHGLTNGTQIRFSNSGGALPTGIAADVTYFVISSATNDFQISLTSGGAAVNFTTDGTGTSGYSVFTNYSSNCRFRNFEITLENNLLADDGYCPGSVVYQTANDATSGLVRNELLFGKRNYTMNFTIRVDSNTDEYALIQAQTPLDILIEAVGAVIGGGTGTFFDKLQMEVKLAQYSAIETGNENGIVTFKLTPQILYDPTTDEVINFVLYNQTPSYLS